MGILGITLPPPDNGQLFPEKTMPIELIEPEISPSDIVEYIIVSDKTSEVILSKSSLTDENPLAVSIETAKLIRRAGGEVTIFKATKY